MKKCEGKDCEVEVEGFKKRIFNEKKELDERIVRLKSFIEADIYAELTAEKQDMMKRQLKAMEVYSLILYERIKAD